MKGVDRNKLNFNIPLTGMLYCCSTAKPSIISVIKTIMFRWEKNQGP